MRLKRSNVAARACMLASFVVLSALVLTAAPALALPEGRVYEMVSPPYKGGYGVGESGLLAVAPDGERVAFGSLGGFAGILSGSGAGANTYLAQRGPSGWSTTGLQPPSGGVADFSASLEETLASAPLGPNMGTVNFGASQQEVLLRRNDAPNIAASWEVDGGIVMELLDGKALQALVQGSSAGFCHVVVGNAEGPLLAEASHASGQIYDLARGCGGISPSLRLLGVKNKLGAHGEPEVFNRQCGPELGIGGIYVGSGSREQESSFNAIAAGGSEMFFTTNVEQGSISCAGAPLQLFVRLDGTRTLEVSRPLEASQPFGGCGADGEVPCPGAAERASAYFTGASEDGSRVFFTTKAPLAAEDKDEGEDLYMATIGCPGADPECEAAKREVTSLVQVSHDSSVGEAAEVQGVLRVAPDGSRVYFVAHGVLSQGANPQGMAPVKGADNLYVYEPDPEHEGQFKTEFVADLCSGPKRTGNAEDARCPSTLGAEVQGINDTHLWGDTPEAQSTSDGRFLVFSTYARLLPGDTDNAKDVYRYDAQTGALERVSIGEAGNDANGNDNAFDATIAPGHMGGVNPYAYVQQEMGTRAISADGSRIVFTTAGPLSPGATNHLANVYEWHEGAVSLISGGSAEEPVNEAVITPSGRDIFFVTSQGLLSQDTDGARDIYDARLEGGFPPAPGQPEECSADACQGPLTNPAPLLVPGSVSQAPGGNFAAPAPATPVKPKTKATPRCSKPKKLSHGRCVKVKAKKKTKAVKAGTDRRAG